MLTINEARVMFYDAPNYFNCLFLSQTAVTVLVQLLMNYQLWNKFLSSIDWIILYTL